MRFFNIVANAFWERYITDEESKGGKNTYLKFDQTQDIKLTSNLQNIVIQIDRIPLMLEFPSKWMKEMEDSRTHR